MTLFNFQCLARQFVKCDSPGRLACKLFLSRTMGLKLRFVAILSTLAVMSHRSVSEKSDNDLRHLHIGNQSRDTRSFCGSFSRITT